MFEMLCEEVESEFNSLLFRTKVRWISRRTFKTSVKPRQEIPVFFIWKTNGSYTDYKTGISRRFLTNINHKISYHKEYFTR